jgi:hypothetical protein
MLERGKRERAESFDAIDREVVGTSWGVGIAFDSRKRNAQKWARITRAEHRKRTGQSGAMDAVSLERQVTALATAHPEYVVIGLGVA